MKEHNVIVKHYDTKEESQLFALIKQEGEDWKEYWDGIGRQKYQKALSNSISYVVLEDGKLCGYIRCRDDDGYGIYVYDLLVDSKYRGKEYGRMLIEQVGRDFPENPIYVMSDVDPYYQKLGYEREGSIFIVKTKSSN